MLTGRQAFPGDTITDVLAAVVTKEPEWDRVPVKVRRLLQACLQKDPKQRLQAIGDWRLPLDDTPQVAPRRYRWLIAVGVAAVLMAVSVLATSRWLPRAPSPTFQRLTFRRGFVDNGRFANGGRTVVYSAAWDGNSSRVYSTQAESPESRDLEIESAGLLSVSRSDEMAIALKPVEASFVPFGTLARVPISGGTPRKVADGIAGADWTSDGTRLAVVRVRPGFQQLEFPIGNVLYQTTGGIVNPRISPKGDLIAFLEEPILGGVGAVATVDMRGNKKTLTEIWLGLISGLAWSSSGDEILFAAAAYGFTNSLYAVNRSGRQRFIAHLSGNFAVLDVAPDGRLLMVHSVFSAGLIY
jgi:hypothetical protein